ncbi:MAG: hypothetical protein ABSF26_22470 [Thermoguttaceae bacterium]|jgi:hypothetical protein
MPLDIPSIAAKLNELAPPHPIGKLQDLRAQLKKLKNLGCRPGDKIFSEQTTFERYAFHHGGRKELQYNIGYADRDKNDDLRHGVAFSFELGRNLKSIGILVPKVKFFNDFMELNVGEFADMRMWWYSNDQRSVDQQPGPISSALVTEGVFVFLGNRQPAGKIDYETILDDFDRLLALYQYVESGRATAPVPLPKAGFDFKPGLSKKVKAAKATLAEKELDLNLRHNLLQEALYRRLASQYGKDNIRAEQPSGVGTKIDIVVKTKNEYWFYEIKTALTPRACLREAIGQLLEYAFWPGSHEPTRFIVVGESPIDKDGQEYLRRLRKRFSLPIEYETIPT